MNRNIFKANLTLDGDFINKKINALLDGIDGKKIKSTIKNKKNIINNLYVELGKITYNNKNNNSKNYYKLVEDICKHIKFEKEAIKKLIKQLEGLSEIEHRENYNHFIEAKTVEEYKIPDNAPEPVVNSEGLSLYKFCPKCQVGNNPEVKKCVYCGAKFNA